jgi:transcription antitermination factor NusG
MSWYVLHLRPRAEKKAVEFCRAMDIESYLPLRRETKIYQRRKVTVEKPLFPGYAFANFSLEGKAKLLTFQHLIRMIPPSNEESFLKQLEQVRLALTADPTLNSCKPLKRGTRVRITGGPFMGIEGIVQNLKNANKVHLNIELISRALSVEVERDFLELVD